MPLHREPTTDEELFSSDDDNSRKNKTSEYHIDQLPFDPRTHNTGPKGVRDDARLHNRIQTEIARQQVLEQYERDYRRAPKTTTYQQDIEHKAHDYSLFKNRSLDGLLTIVDADGYLDATEKFKQLIVLVYDETDESVEISNALSELARLYRQCKFVALHSKEAELDDVGVPAILGYHNGQLEVNLVRVIDEIPPGEKVNAESLKEVLIRYDALSDLGIEYENE